MRVDETALADRLFADALAADLRVPDAFLRSRNDTKWDTIESHVRGCAEVYQDQLSATPAMAERAMEKAESEWHKVAGRDDEVRVVTVLVRAARRLLQPNGREMVLRVNRDEPGREILRWRFVSLALPPGILVAAATARGSPPPAAVRLLHSPMAPDVPVAQQHVHHAAMMSFEELWASLRLRALLQPTDLLGSLRAERARCPRLHRGACPGKRSGTKEKRLFKHAGHMAEWCSLIQQAFIARRVLDRHAYHAVPLSACADPVCVTGRMRLRSFVAGRTNPNQQGLRPYPWSGERHRLQRRFRMATAPAMPGQANVRRDCLLSKLAAEERDILVRAFEHVHAAETEPPHAGLGDSDWRDLLYEMLLLQYLRIKTALFGLLVHPPGELGLQKFLEHFTQIKVYAPETALPRPAASHIEPGLRVHAVERRVSPDDWPEKCERWDWEGDPRHASEPGLEKAWLVHFQRKPFKRGGLPLYGDSIRQLNADGDRVVRALMAEPRRLDNLRGIDICGVEADQPLWVSAETLRHVRARSSEIAGRRPGLRLQPLRLTLHAGEDFEWLTSGVRAVAEPFLWKLIERGDRIGHGIAITFDPKDWWERKAGQVMPVSRFDRLLDLAFLAKYTAGKRSAEQDEWLLAQIQTTVKELRLERRKAGGAGVGEPNLVETAQKVWRELGRQTTRRLSERPRERDTLDPHERWIHDYLWNRSTQKHACQEIRLKVDDDGGDLRIESQRTERDLLIIARERLIDEVARWQVCIESNPSSNLVVGGLDAVGAAQDFLQQRPTGHAGRGAQTLTWTISTDDPITFSTTLADEYAYAWAGMVLRHGKEYDPAYARALLDEAAATSMRTRFTIPPDRQKQTERDTRRRRRDARSD
jgi:hypothetical protein